MILFVRSEFDFNLILTSPVQLVIGQFPILKKLTRVLASLQNGLKIVDIIFRLKNQEKKTISNTKNILARRTAYVFCIDVWGFLYRRMVLV